MGKLLKLLIVIGNTILSYFLSIAIVGNWGRFTENLSNSNSINDFLTTLLNYGVFFYPIVVCVAIPLTIILSVLVIRFLRSA